MPGTRQSVRVRADRPVDDAVVRRCITIVDDTRGRAIVGRPTLREKAGNGASFPTPRGWLRTAAWSSRPWKTSPATLPSLRRP